MSVPHRLKLGMAASEVLEVERKYDPQDSDALPSLTSLPGVDHLGTAESHDLDATYFDTANLALASRGITLRRRTGGTDAGWHLKLPVTEGERREITEPLGGDPDSVPLPLAQLVRVHARAQKLQLVARLKTHRTVLPLQSADGTVLAEFSDDHVDAQAPGVPDAPARWREWEIELVDGPRRLLKDADALCDAGGVPAALAASKLARALGSRYPANPAALPKPHRKAPASAVLLAYLYQQVEALKTHDPGVRTDAPDAVHQLRVAARRMRSALATFGKLTEPGTAKPLRAELKWLASTVGQARDTEVMRSRLREMIDAEPPELLLGPVAQQIEEHLGAIHHDARAAGLAALDSDRYFHLLDSLDAFLAAPPLSGRAGKKALRTMGQLVSAERKRLVKAVRAAFEEEAREAAEDISLHEVRKSAKRLRYAAEAVAPVFGKQATSLARDAEGIQETLGTLQDSVVTRETLRDLAAQAPASGGNGFSYGRLHALEQQRGTEAREEFIRGWQKSRPKPLHIE
jgi:CHAD domain-containing protein